MLLKLRTLGLFRAGVSLVPITALVRDARNRIVRHLQRDDFQVLEGGRLRTIVDFGASENAPVSVAFLFDTSGSMAVAANLAKGRDFVEDFVGEISPGADRVALFTLDKRLRHDVRFTSDPDEIYDALNEVRAWGMTSLYDAIAEALTPEQVSALASSIDVPVHVAAVVSPLDHPGAATAVVPGGEGSLSRLARWTH
jgi:VWFA-related protein